ncbi:DMT family transporter [Ramlibacter henchirensis]|uniref:DMT family transporter n=1 Tax=Ramlibacter henchirensis TaxID=204072 RepID=A0A4Z0C916_9BURK|nr:DMT family transporter [Ramlibacter henchirensis]TFZ07382.1 DMT family transporter [Ramlibacter henchirensis]
MQQRLTPGTVGLLVLPPLLWAGNAVVGRVMAGSVPPMTLNFLRWAIAFVLLLPFAAQLLKPGSSLWPHWRRFLLLGLLGVGCYNALQYLALTTSTPLNVTLVGASMPAWMLAIGAMFFGQRITMRQVTGAALSITGVLVVLSRGDWDVLLQVRLVPGDIFILLATASWTFYSWLLVRPGDPPEIRGNWTLFLMAQLVFGLGWSGLFAGAEWLSAPQHIEWGWPTILALAYIALGPAILAYRSWGLGVQRVGPNIAGFFSNLSPLFAAVLSAAFLGELPSAYHAVAFLLIVGGIVVSSRKTA